MTTRITREQSRDTGMAMVLLFLLAQLTFPRDGFLFAAIGLHVVNMIAPQVFYPVAVVWFGLAHIMGRIMSRVLLALIFGLVVTPIGLIRRALGNDSLRLRAFKAGDESVMTSRRHMFTGRDLERPY